MELLLFSDWVLFEDIYNSFTYTDTMSLLQIRGDGLRQLLKNTVRNHKRNKPSFTFMQVSGIRVVYDLSRPPNRRVVDVKVCEDHDCKTYSNLDVKKTYGVSIRKLFTSLPFTSMYLKPIYL